MLSPPPSPSRSPSPPPPPPSFCLPSSDVYLPLPSPRLCYLLASVVSPPPLSTRHRRLPASNVSLPLPPSLGMSSVLYSSLPQKILGQPKCYPGRPRAGQPDSMRGDPARGYPKIRGNPSLIRSNPDSIWGCNYILNPGCSSGATGSLDVSFSCVVKTQRRWSNKIYKTEFKKTRYNNPVLGKYRVDPQRAGLTLIAELT